MMNAILNTELHTDPLGMGYAALMPTCPGNVADKLNAQTRTIARSVSMPAFLAWAASNGMRAVLQDKANATGDALRSSALAMLDIIGNSTSLDLSSSTIGQGNLSMLQAWVAAGAMTQVQHDALVALASQPCSRAQELGLQPVTALDVIGSW